MIIRNNTPFVSFRREDNLSPWGAPEEGDSKVTFGHPQTSFFETIDEQSAIVPAQIAEVRIWKNFSLTWTHPNPLYPLLGGSRSLRSRSLRDFSFMSFMLLFHDSEIFNLRPLILWRLGNANQTSLFALLSASWYI